MNLIFSIPKQVEPSHKCCVRLSSHYFTNHFKLPQSFKNRSINLGGLWPEPWGSRTISCVILKSVTGLTCGETNAKFTLKNFKDDNRLCYLKEFRKLAQAWQGFPLDLTRPTEYSIDTKTEDLSDLSVFQNVAVVLYNFLLFTTHHSLLRAGSEQANTKAAQGIPRLCSHTAGSSRYLPGSQQEIDTNTDRQPIKQISALLQQKFGLPRHIEIFTVWLPYA